MSERQDELRKIAEKIKDMVYDFEVCYGDEVESIRLIHAYSPGGEFKLISVEAEAKTQRTARFAF